MKTIVIESFDKKHSGLFNNENNYGLKLSLEQQIKNSNFISKLSQIILDQLVKNIKKEYPVNDIFIKEISRRNLLPILFFFFDRFYRIKKVIKNEKASCFKLKKNNFIFNHIDELEKKFVNYDFNNFLISYQKKIFNLSYINSNYPKKKIKSKNVINSKFRNYMGNVSNNRFKLRVIKFIEHFSDIFLKKKIVTSNVAHFEDSFRKKLFFLRFIKKINFKVPFFKLKKDFNKRCKIFEFNKKIINNLTFNKEYNLDYLQASNLLESLKNFLIEVYPIQSLEGIKHCYDYLVLNFKYTNFKYYLVDGDSDYNSTAVFSYIASLNNIKIIRFNHGGGAGYIIDNRYSIEMVYPRCDYFISWGLKKYPNSNNIKKFYILPNPWLSEKFLYWRKNFFFSKKKYDVLYMPQLIKSYSGSLEGASSFSRDTYDLFCDQFKLLILTCIKNNISILIKPYSDSCYFIFKNLIKDFNSKNINLLFPDQKSIDKKLLNLSNLVIHDYPGSGFLETISSNIPSLIIWNKKICKEYDFLKKYFKALKNDGIIHYSINSIISEILRFKKNPKNWMRDKSKKQSIKNFIIKFCNIDEKWNHSWIKFLYKI